MSRPHADVTVVIATYKRPHLIERALDSVAAQTLRPAEIIVVDDASQDRTAEVVEGWSRRCGEPVRFIAMERNGGAGAARNRAMALAKHAYVAFLDSDDEYLPHALETLVPPLDRHPQAVVSFADAHIVVDGQPSGELLMSRALPPGACEPTGEEGLLRLVDPVGSLLPASMIPTCAAVFRGAAAARVGFMPEHRFGEDWLFWLRLAGEGRFVARFVPVARVHRHGDNLTADSGAAEASAQLLKGYHALATGRAGIALAPRHRTRVEAALAKQARAWRYHQSRLGLTPYLAALRGELGRATGGAMRHLLDDPKSLLRAAMAGLR